MAVSTTILSKYKLNIVCFTATASIPKEGLQLFR